MRKTEQLHKLNAEYSCKPVQMHKNCTFEI